MHTWNEFHSDPRKSYYLFLRRGYQCSARAAHAKVRQIDAMVVGLQRESCDGVAVSWLAAVTNVLGLFTSLRRSWEQLCRRALPWRSVMPPHAQKRLASRFSHIA